MPEDKPAETSLDNSAKNDENSTQTQNAQSKSVTEHLLSEKLSVLSLSLESLKVDLPQSNIAVYTSQEKHFRMRAEFKLWHQGSSARYAMSDPQTKKPIFIDQFPIACKTINQLMSPLLEAINGNDLLRKKCFQVEFLSTLSGDTLITLIYHRALTDEWIAAIAPVKAALGVNIIGRSRKQKIILDRDFVTEKLMVNGKSFTYKQIEGSFTQPNASICEKMLSWAVTNSKGFTGDLLELYCGNGNFTLPLSFNFNQVLATEISKTAVNAAQDNIAINDINNVNIIRMSSEDFVQAWDKVRAFRRLKDINLDDYQFSTVFVDPPRAGLDDETIKMVKRFDNIIYISCKPETLIENLKHLCESHTIRSLAAFDQFPHTPHLETGVILSRKQ